MRRRQRQLEAVQAAATARARLARVVAPPRRSGRTGWTPDPPLFVPEPVVAPSDRWKKAAADVFQRSPRADWLLGRRQAIVIVLLLAAALVGAIAAYVSARPSVEPVTPVTESTGTPLDEHAGNNAGGGDNRAAKELIVHVAGLVKSPGVVTLPTGSRVIDALEAAGGAKGKADLTLLNLARVLADGEQVLVGSEAADASAKTGGSAADGAGAAGAGTGSSGGALMSLNTATLEQLETLPGIGPALGQRILDWRTEHGQFSTVDELREVAGIGEVTFGELEPLVTV